MRDAEARREYQRNYNKTYAKRPEVIARLKEKRKVWYANLSPERKQETRARWAATKRRSERRVFKKNPILYLLKSARRRAKTEGIEFSLLPSDLVMPDVCPIFGTPIRIQAGNHAEGASIDRIDNRRGYVPGNVAIISRRANRMKGDLSIEMMEKLIAYMKAHGCA